MEFDRKGPEGGLEIYTSISNGKALLECKVHLRKAVAEELLEEANGISCARKKDAYLDIRVWDREEQLVFCCMHPLWQEETARGIMLHPHLWQGVEDPYLYRIRVCLMEQKEYAVDTIETTFALRTLREHPNKGWYLNDSLFSIRPVAYAIPDAASLGCMTEEKSRTIRIRQDIEMMCRMGANTICPVGGEIDREFCQLCDEWGLLLWWQKPVEDSRIPRFYGTENSLFSLHGRYPTDNYYFHKACWSSEPFVYISTASLSLQPNGNAQVMVYSNQKKVALYVEGTLFEFGTEGPDFLFHELPVKRLPLLLTAEAGECCMSVTAYP